MQQRRMAVRNGLTALAGGGQTGAIELYPRTINRVTTVATAADSALLPDAAAGEFLTVINAAAANSMNVFPRSNQLVNALAADAAFAIAANKTVDFYCAVDGVWNTNLTA
jgi:hypothetical protein